MFTRVKPVRESCVPRFQHTPSYIDQPFMSQSIQERIEAALISRFPSDGPVNRTMLVESDLPSGIRHFLLSSLDRRVHLACVGMLDQGEGWIDPGHPSVLQAATRLTEQLRAAGQFPRKEWPKAISQSVEAQLAYLQEPAHALAEFSFSAGSPTLTTSDLRRRTEYFSDYPYMARAVDAWLTKRDEREIDRDAFESAMRHLDCRLTEDYSEEQWIQLLAPLTETMQFAGVQPAGLPVHMVARFFEAKERPAIADLIRSAAALHRAEMITLPSLQDIIQKAFENERLMEAEHNDAVSNEVDPEPGPDGTGHSRNEAAEATDRADPAQDSGPAVPPGESNSGQPLPLWKRFQQRVDGPEAGSGTPAKPSERGAQPLWKSFEKPAGKQPAAASSTPPSPGPLPSGIPSAPAGADPVPIRQAPRLEAQHIVLGTAVRSKDRFIRDLFDGNESMYAEVMEALAEAPDWTQASSIIADRIFRPNRIDIYSEVAVSFTDAVEARYSGLQS